MNRKISYLISIFCISGSIVMASHLGITKNKSIPVDSEKEDSSFTIFGIKTLAPDLEGELRNEYVRRIKSLEDETDRSFGISDKGYNTIPARLIRDHLIEAADEKILKYSQTGREKDIPKMLFLKKRSQEIYDDIWARHIKNWNAHPTFYYYFAIPELGEVKKVIPGEKFRLKVDAKNPIVHFFIREGNQEAKREAYLIAKNPEKFFADRGEGEKARVYTNRGERGFEWVGPDPKGLGKDLVGVQTSTSTESDKGSSPAASPRASSPVPSDGSSVASKSPASTDSWLSTLATIFKGRKSGGSDQENKRSQKSPTKLSKDKIAKYGIDNEGAGAYLLQDFSDSSSDGSYSDDDGAGAAGRGGYRPPSKIPKKGDYMPVALR